MAKKNEAMEQAAAESQRTASKFFPDEPMVKINVLFHKDDGIGPQVEAYPNGIRYTIMRGKVVEVPQIVYLTLLQTGRFNIVVMG
jgi:hypothetical protein